MRNCVDQVGLQGWRAMFWSSLLMGEDPARSGQCLSQGFDSWTVYREDKLNSRQKRMCSFLSLLSAVETMWITVFSSRNFDLPAAVGHALEKGGKINSLSPELLCVRVFYHSNGSKAKTLSFFFPYPYDQGREGTTGKMWGTLYNTLQLQSSMIINACSHHACHNP